MKLRSQHKTRLDEVMCTPSYGPREDQQGSKLPELPLYYQSYLSAFKRIRAQWRFYPRRLFGGAESTNSYQFIRNVLKRKNSIAVTT